MTDIKVSQEARAVISIDELREVIEYDPETGSLIWKPRRRSHPFYNYGWNSKYAGKPAMIRVDQKGYLSGKIFNKCVKAHAVAWAIYHGIWPDRAIDHLNGVRDDNRLSNLRLATPSDNSKNMALRKDNTSGVGGITKVMRKASSKWQVYLKVGGKRHYGGVFQHFEEALAARNKMADNLGFSRGHGTRDNRGYFNGPTAIRTGGQS